MHFLKNLSIKHKLKLAFGTIIVFCTVASAIGAFGIGTVFTNSRILYTDFGQSQGTVNRLLADFKQNELLTNTLLVNQSAQGQQTLLDALNANKSTLLESFEESNQKGYLSHLAPEELLELQSLLETYFSTQATVVQLATSGDAQQAIQLFTQELMVEGDQVDTMIQKVISSQAQAGQEMLLNLGATTSQVMTILGVFALVSIAYSLAITIKMSSSIGKSVQGIMDGMEELGGGNLTTRIPVLSSDDLGRISQKFNETCEVLDTYVSHVNHTMEQVSSGRLVYNDTLVFQGDFLSMQQAIMDMIHQENQLIRMVQTNTQQVSTAASQVSDSAQSLAQGAVEQASSVEELAASVSDLSQQMNDAVKDAATTSEKAEEAGELTRRTNEKMERMVEAMEEISTVSQQMGRIVESINNIAFQTDILALNAAVEAARAGTSGKGFAVIADTVRHLAIKSSEEARETAKLLDSTLLAVSTGKELAADASALVHNTAAASQQAALYTGKILETLTSQSTALNQINLGLEQISAVIQNNSASAEEGAAASQQLHAQSEELERHIRSFSLD